MGKLKRQPHFSIQLENKYIDLLDVKRGGETRASYIRRACELDALGATVTAPTMAKHFREPGLTRDPRYTVIQMRVSYRLQAKIREEVRKHRLVDPATPFTLREYFRAVILSTPLESRFPEFGEVTVVVSSEVAKAVDPAKLAKHLAEHWRSYVRD